MKIELKCLNDIDPCELAYAANDPQIHHYLRNSFPYPYTLDHAMSFISYSLQHQAVDFGIVVDNVCVGCIGVTFHNDIYKKNCDIGYWLNSHYWRRGIMSKVVHMLCYYLFTNYSITKICAEVYAKNIASCQVLEHNQFVMEGYLKNHAFKDGQYYDLILYSLRETNYEYKKV